jgi:imidazolonepropionase
MKKLTGPFTQILPLTELPLKGALKDEQLHIIPNGGVLVEDGLILAVGSFEELRKTNPYTYLFWR